MCFVVGFFLFFDYKLFVHYEGRGEYFGPKAGYGQGDVIGCGIDQINNYLYFYKNGIKISSKTNHGYLSFLLIHLKKIFN